MIHISILVIPTIVTLIVIAGLFEKKNVYDIFCDGAVDGIKTMKKMFPTLIGIFLAIGMVRSSGILDFVAEKLNIITKGLNLPHEILPLMILKPISGSASMAFATDLMTQYGVDSRIGLIAGTIMSSSETTFYVIAIYLSAVKIKKSGNVIVPALIADITTMIVALLILH